MTGDSAQVAVIAGLPPMAVPMTVKMPEPMTAPMPSAVSETGPSVFFSAVSGCSLSAISLSMDLVAKIWRGFVRVLAGLGGRRQVVRSSLRKFGSRMKRLYAESHPSGLAGTRQSCAGQQKTGEAVASPVWKLEG